MCLSLRYHKQLDLDGLYHMSLAVFHESIEPRRSLGVRIHEVFNYQCYSGCILLDIDGTS